MIFGDWSANIQVVGGGGAGEGMHSVETYDSRVIIY